jgi:hypothetical protein
VHANTTSPGQGAFTFADGTTIPYSFEFQFVLTEGNFTFQGQRSGSASGQASFVTQRTSPTGALQCGGAGIKTAPMDMSLSTQSPLTSARPEPPAAAGGGGSAPARVASLRLAAHPHGAHARRRTAFTFQVTADGRAVRGATVTLAGHHALAGSRGVARIGAALPRGRWTARATKPGYRAAQVTIRVR